MHEPTPKMRRCYRNPPVEEALVEFRFVPGQGWDPTLPGKLHQHTAIKSGYTGKPRTQKIVEAALEAGRDQPSQMTLREGFSRVQLVNENGTRLISLGPDVLSVNVLRPYEGWIEFRQRIETALQAYAEVAEPGGVSRVGVRYINKINLPAQEIELKTWFRCGPPTVPELPGKIAGFVSRVEFLYPDAVKLLLTQASIEAPDGPPAVLLDLDVLWESGETRSPDAIMTLVDDLHERAGNAFEALITDAARERFDAD